MYAYRVMAALRRGSIHHTAGSRKVGGCGLKHGSRWSSKGQGIHASKIMRNILRIVNSVWGVNVNVGVVVADRQSSK